MRAAGIDTLRLFVWHMHDASDQSWGVVSSEGCATGAAEQKNLVNYAADARLAGFTGSSPSYSGPSGRTIRSDFRITVTTLRCSRRTGTSSRTSASWSNSTGPASTHFDLLNEGAPSDYLATRAQLAAYLARLYSNYVDAFGNQDVTISSIVAANDQSRISNLIHTLRSTGRPLPIWFQLHLYSGTLLEDLRATDVTLTAKGFTQPITIGETNYNDPEAAKAVKDFNSLSSRRLTEVIEWPLKEGERMWRHFGCATLQGECIHRSSDRVGSEHA